jgi:hypothetical protein
MEKMYEKSAPGKLFLEGLKKVVPELEVVLVGREVGGQKLLVDLEVEGHEVVAPYIRGKQLWPI